MWPHNAYETWLLSLPALIPYMVMMSLKMMERKTPFTSETFLKEYDYIVGKYVCLCLWCFGFYLLLVARAWRVWLSDKQGLEVEKAKAKAKAIEIEITEEIAIK